MTLYDFLNHCYSFRPQNVYEPANEVPIIQFFEAIELEGDVRNVFFDSRTEVVSIDMIKVLQHFFNDRLTIDIIRKLEDEMIKHKAFICRSKYNNGTFIFDSDLLRSSLESAHCITDKESERNRINRLINELNDYNARLKDTESIFYFLQEKIKPLSDEISALQSNCNHIYENKVNPHYTLKTCKNCFHEIKD